jgi:maleate isomerase
VAPPAAKRVGLLVVSTDLTIEGEMRRFLPAGIELYVTRMRLRAVTPDALAEMNRESAAAVQLIADVAPDLIVYGCTSGSFLQGHGYDRAIEAAITAQTGCPALTTAHALVEALTALQTTRLVVCSPYVAALVERAAQFLRAAGFTVTQIHGLGLDDDHRIGSLSPAAVYDFARQHDDPAADALCLSCTSLRTLDIVGPLQEALGKPVVSSTLATLWGVCQRLQTGVDLPLFRAWHVLDHAWEMDVGHE